MRAGAIAGTLTNRGYRQLKIEQRFYSAGPLAFIWMTGRWPTKVIDHANCIKDDNRWSNLRAATRSQNAANGHIRKNKLYSNLKGVTWSKRDQMFRATIKVNYRLINLGRFDTQEKAHAAYVAAARRHFGSFARY